MLIIVLYTLAAVAYGLVTPIYEGPDEIGHILYVKHIAEGLGIPVQSREYAIRYGFGQEGSQAPLYYALGAGWVRLWGLSLEGLHGLPPANPFSTCGQPESGYNVAGFRHDPRTETFPYHGVARTVHVLRLFSAVLGAITILATYVTARLAFPNSPSVALLAAAWVAFNPQFAFMGGVVNNDNLVNALTSTSVALAVYGFHRRYPWWLVLTLGATCGLATLAKLGGLTALAFAALCLAVSSWRQPRRLFRDGALLGLAFLLTAGWWFYRNWRLYGDPTGLQMMLSIYGGRNGWPSELVIPELWETFRSYWGVFACRLSYPPPIHEALGGVTLLALGAFAWRWKRLSRHEQLTTGMMLGWLALVFVSWVRWNQITYAPLGRLWFQANAALGTILGYGLFAVTQRLRWARAVWAAAMYALAISGALFIVRPAFALPPRHTATEAPAPSVTLPDAYFGDRIRAIGYGLDKRSLNPGETLEVTLLLEVTEPVTQDYALALQLLSAVPGDTETLVNFNTIPGRGNYPSFAWRPDETIIERYRLRLPKEVARAQAWRVIAILYRLSDGKRLPVRVAGQPAGDTLGLELVRVGASTTQPPPTEALLDPAPLFGGSIRLRALTVQSLGGRLQVQAWWQAEAPLDTDYTAFVHLYTANQQLAATGDRPPLNGGFPTSLWQPGDQIVETYALEPVECGDDRELGLGWYDPTTGARLPVTVNGISLPDNVYRLALK